MYNEILRMIDEIDNVDLSDIDINEKGKFLVTHYTNLLDLIKGSTSISLKEKIELSRLVVNKINNILNNQADYSKNDVKKTLDYDQEQMKNIAFMVAKIRFEEQSSLKKFINRLLNKESFKVYERNYKFLSIDQINELYRRK